MSDSVPGEPGAYLINRFGPRFAEVRPDNSVKVDLSGRVIDGSGALGAHDGLILESPAFPSSAARLPAFGKRHDRRGSRRQAL